MYFKDFDSWVLVKKRINEEKRKINIRAGEVRWASLGVNIGSEIDGKGVSFTRPVVVVNVSGSTLALVVPMSTKIKKGVAGYVEFQWKDKVVSLCIHQAKTISQKRLLRRMGRISDTKIISIKAKIKKFFDL